MKYTIEQFKTDFPDDDACLDFLFKKNYPKITGYYRIRGRKAYANAAGHHISPLSGTMFHKSSTNLWKWFFALYLFSQSKHGVSAAELQRNLGVTYKCAWRICHKIRELMAEPERRLSGTVECDEAYIGGKRRLAVQHAFANKTPVFGMVSRKGYVIAQPVPDRKGDTLLPIIKRSVKRHTRLITDDFSSYGYVETIKHRKYRHKTVNHSAKEYVRVEGRTKIHTNTIEGFWSGLKRQINGCHHSVSPQHLSKYVNEVTFRYNHRHELIFPLLLERV